MGPGKARPHSVWVRIAAPIGNRFRPRRPCPPNPARPRGLAPADEAGLDPREEAVSGRLFDHLPAPKGGAHRPGAESRLRRDEAMALCRDGESCQSVRRRSTLTYIFTRDSSDGSNLTL